MYIQLKTKNIYFDEMFKILSQNLHIKKNIIKNNIERDGISYYIINNYFYNKGYYTFDNNKIIIKEV